MHFDAPELFVEMWMGCPDESIVKVARFQQKPRAVWEKSENQKRGTGPPLMDRVF